MLSEDKVRSMRDTLRAMSDVEGAPMIARVLEVVLEEKPEPAEPLPSDDFLRAMKRITELQEAVAATRARAEAAEMKILEMRRQHHE